MDKQQAITYIKERLDQDLSREEIVRGLVDQLHAPEAMVSRFVAQVETEYRKDNPEPAPTPVPPPPVKLPPWLEELSSGQSMPVGQVATTAESNASGPSWEAEDRTWVQTQIEIGRLRSDIVEELADRMSVSQYRAEEIVSSVTAQMNSLPLPRITNSAEAASFVKDAYASGRPRLEIAAQLAARTAEPQELAEKFVAQTIAQIEQVKAGQPPAPTGARPELDTPERVKYVIGQFARHRKRSDIVMALCERTGADWQEAQRFVAQVYAEHHAGINARKNILIVPMGIGAVVLGVLLTIGSAYPALLWLSNSTSKLNSLAHSGGWFGNYVQVAPYLFFTGIALFAGGVVGLVTALRSQMN